MTRSWLTSCSVLLLTMAFGGCGSGNEASPAARTEAQAKKTPAVTVSRDNPCSVMFPSEVSSILGRPSTLREVVDEITCRYHFEPAEQRPADADQETFIEVKVHWTDGRTAITAARLAGKIMGGASGGFEKVPDLGDEAWLAPLASYLVFSRGDIGVEIDMRMLPGEKEKAVGLARLMAGRL